MNCERQDRRGAVVELPRRACPTVTLVSLWISVFHARRERAAEPCVTCEGKRPTHPAARAHHLSLDRAACLMAMRRGRLPPPLEQICTVAAACHWRVVDAPSPTTWRLVPLAYELRTQDKPLDAIKIGRASSREKGCSTCRFRWAP